MEYANFTAFTEAVKGLEPGEILNRCDEQMRKRPPVFYKSDIMFLADYLHGPTRLSLAAMRPDLYQGVWRVVDSLIERKWLPSDTIKLFQV